MTVILAATFQLEILLPLNIAGLRLNMPSYPLKSPGDFTLCVAIRNRPIRVSPWLPNWKAG